MWNQGECGITIFIAPAFRDLLSDMSYMVEFERITNVTDYGDYDEACSDDEEERQAEVYFQVPRSPYTH